MRPVPASLVPLVAAATLALSLAACAGPRHRPPPVDPAVAERARAAGLLAEADRAEAAREAVALALRAPRMAYPVLVPSDLGAFRLDGATVEDDDEAAYYALRYRRPDGACFAVTGADDEQAVVSPSGGGSLDSVAVEVRALHAVAVVYRLPPRPEEAGGPGDLVSRPIDAGGLGVTFSSPSGEGCRPVALAEAVALVAGLRPLDPADDLDGAYRPLDLTRIQAQREGEDSEALARLAFAPPGSTGEVTVETVRRTERRAVVLVTTRQTGGDVVQDEQVRAVFVYGDEGPWRLVAAGERYRCQPGRGHEDWSPDPCLYIADGRLGGRCRARGRPNPAEATEPVC